jgi:phage gpG-like protein
MSNQSSNNRAEKIALELKKLSAQDQIILQKRLGQTAVAQAQLGVRQGRDPYGTPWAPLTSREGRPLRQTGNNIQRSWTAGGETPDSFKFGSRFKYLATHQYGATIRPVRARGLRFKIAGQFVFARQVTIPRRQLVPEQDTGGLGKRWTSAFDRTIKRFMSTKFKD